MYVFGSFIVTHYFYSAHKIYLKKIISSLNIDDQVMKIFQEPW